MAGAAAAGLRASPVAVPLAPAPLRGDGMASLRLACLPAVQVVRDGRPVTTFRSVSERALLVYLAVEGQRPHDRAALAGLLWPDAPEPVARRNLNQTLFNLRGALGDP